MTDHKVVTRAEWIEARKALLKEEKAFSRARDALSAARRTLPWVRVDTDYVFDGPDGRESLADLFAGRSQLIVYHFMFGPEWEEGCPHCSLLADHFDGAMVHINHRDVTMVAISRAPYEKLVTYRDRMDWRFKWLSSLGNDFNRDFQVSFTAEEVASKTASYNYGTSTFPSEEAHGLSVFVRDADGIVYHAYSTYGRGLDLFIGAYNLLDHVPKGRDEDDLPWTMAWVRRHDQYED